MYQSRVLQKEEDMDLQQSLLQACILYCATLFFFFCKRGLPRIATM